MTKCAICSAQTNELDQCPCGKKVCCECQEQIYTDEVCCKDCADELRAGWDACPQHEFDQPYENEDGDLIQECKHCSFPQRVPDAEVTR